MLILKMTWQEPKKLFYILRGRISAGKTIEKGDDGAGLDVGGWV